MSEAGVRASFRAQAEACRRLGSPFIALVCDLLADRLDGTSRFGRRILAWPGDPGADALPLRAAGGLNALARRGDRLAAVYPPRDGPDPDRLWAGIAAAIRDHDGFLHDFLDSPPQTNEVGRSAVLLGAALIVAALTGRPLSWLEIGASAGLNLGFDLYRYELDGPTWGEPRSPVVIPCAWRGPLPPLDAPLVVAERAACDRRPLDPAAPDDRARLMAYVWPDQPARIARLAAALECMAGTPWRVEQADAAEFVERRLASAPAPGFVRVVAHTIVWQYLPEPTATRIRAAITSAGRVATREAPVAWLRMEPDGLPPGVAVRLTLWPGGEERLLGRADYHGRWTEWVYAESRGSKHGSGPRDSAGT